MVIMTWVSVGMTAVISLQISQIPLVQTIYMYMGFGFCYLTSISTIFKLNCGGGNRSTWRKPPTCRKSLTNFITQRCIEYTLP